MVDTATNEVMFYVRKVDTFEIDVDAKPSLPPLLLCAFLLCLNMCPF